LSQLPYIKLSDLTNRIKDAIKENFGEQSYWIVAEVSGHKFYDNPERHYLEFLEKDELNRQPIAKVRGVAWTGGSERIRLFEKESGQKFGNGLQVLVLVRIEFNAAYGFNLVLLDINPAFTIGKIEQQKRDTLERLLRENPDKVVKVGEEYLTFNKRQHLPQVIQYIALLGSPNSEGFSDFCHTLQSNRFGYSFKLEVYQSAVQGEGADAEIKSKLLHIFSTGKKYDAVVIIRGGGSKSDLLTFDAYGLAQTVARFPIPIITGLGHHNDVSIVDLMAHTATKTPTKAAEFVVSHNRTFEEALVYLQQNILIKTQQLLSATYKRITEINRDILDKSRSLLLVHKEEQQQINQLIIHKTKDILFAQERSLLSLFAQLSTKPTLIIGNRRNELEYQQANLKSHSQKLISLHKGYLNHHATVIRMMSPESLLKKGFAILSYKGKIVSNASQLKPGEEIEIQLEKHEISAQIQTIKETDGDKY
jgi:exodeoxyribonuclease VII large subunit